MCSWYTVYAVYNMKLDGRPFAIFQQLFQLREGDTGSSSVQVVALTTRIQQLQTHMAKHKKDNSSKRGLDRMYVRRRKVLDYMERKSDPNYRKVVKSLGLVR